MSGETPSNQSNRSAPKPVRGRGGPLLKPDAFAKKSKPGIVKKPVRPPRPNTPAGRAPKQAAQPRRLSARALYAPAVSAVQERTEETLGRMHRFQRRARLRVSDSIATTRTRVANLLAKPRNQVDELECAARGRTVSNRIESLCELDRDETNFIREFSMSQTRIYQSGSEIVQERERAPEPAFIASGWACRVRILKSGRRQIIGFLLPGDAIGLRGAAEPDAATTIGALTHVESISARDLIARVERSNQYSNLERAIQRAEAQEKEFLMNQIVRLGAMSPYERFADLMRELKWRLRQSGLADENVFPMPLDRVSLSSSLNMSGRELRSALGRMRRRQGLRIRSRRAQLPETKAGAKPETGGFTAPSTTRPPGAPEGPRIISF